MINDNVLGDRLNDFLNKPAETEETYKLTKPKTSLAINAIANIFDALWSAATIFLTAFILGFTLKTILGTHWSGFELMVIGLATNTVMTYVHNLIHGLPEKK